MKGIEAPKHKRIRSRIYDDVPQFCHPMPGVSGTYHLTIDYFNYTSQHVRITDANDISQIVLSDPKETPNRKEILNHVVIRHTYHVKSANLEAFYKEINSRDAANTPAMEKLRKEVNQYWPGRYHQYEMFEFTVLYLVHISDIGNNPEGVFDEQSNIVIAIHYPGLEHEQVQQVNPIGMDRYNFIDAGVPLVADETLEFNNGIGGIFIDIVDNERKIAPRYIKIVGGVLKIVPRQDHTRTDGVYYYYSEPNGVRLRNSLLLKKVLGFDALTEKNGFFLTNDDANREAELRKQEADIRKAELDNEALRLKKEQQELNADNMRFAAKVEKDRLKKEEEKNNKKEGFWSRVGEGIRQASDLLKYTAAFIVAGITLYTTFNKLKNA